MGTGALGGLTTTTGFGGSGGVVGAVVVWANAGRPVSAHPAIRDRRNIHFDLQIIKIFPLKLAFARDSEISTAGAP